MNRIFNTVVINTKGYAVVLFSYLLFSWGISLFIGYYIRSATPIFVGVFLSIIILTIFDYRLKKIFSKNVVVKLTPENFSVEFVVQVGGEFEKVDTIPFNEMKSFKTGKSGKTNSAYLKIRTTDELSYYYSFLFQGQKEGYTDIAEEFFSTIIKYNSTHGGENRIEFIKGFYATNVGKFFIVLVGLALVVTIAFQIEFKSSTVLFSLFGTIGLFLSILVQRKQDLDFSKRMKMEEQKLTNLNTIVR
jgi:hypothetical protein